MYVGMAILYGMEWGVRASDNLEECQEAAMGLFRSKYGMSKEPGDTDYIFVVFIGPWMQEERRWVFFTDTQLWTEV